VSNAATTGAAPLLPSMPTLLPSMTTPMLAPTAATSGYPLVSNDDDDDDDDDDDAA
jgi:hypothetical protein